MIWFILIACGMAIWNIALWLRMPKVLVLNKLELDIERLALAVMKATGREAGGLYCFEHENAIYISTSHWGWRSPERCIGKGDSMRAALEKAARNLIMEKERNAERSRSNSSDAEKSIRMLKRAIGEK